MAVPTSIMKNSTTRLSAITVAVGKVTSVAGMFDTDTATWTRNPVGAMGMKVGSSRSLAMN